MMGGSLFLFGDETARTLIETTANPFMALFLGLLATAILQSSSATTTMIVNLVTAGMVISDPEATISAAVPLILGANIGTTITSSIASLGHITSKSEFRNAVAGSTIHDFFNIISVLVIFPLEILFGVLSKPALYFANLLPFGQEGEISLNVLDHTIRPISDAILHGLLSLVGTESKVLPVLAFVFSLGLLFLSLRSLAGFFKVWVRGKTQQTLDRAIFGRPWKSLMWGVGLTAIIQSSSVMTSLIVPMVATGKVTLKKAFPFVMGANIGTTTTALIASMVAVGGHPTAGIAVALCHLLFNVYGVLLLFPVRKIRAFPVWLANKLGDATLNNRIVGVIYIVVVFFLVPFIMILLSGGFRGL